jgi:hypothetical protein
VNTRTPEQEAAIDAAIVNLENLLRQRRALRVGRGTRIDDAINSAVVGAALAIVAEPKGQGETFCGLPLADIEAYDRGPAAFLNRFERQS